MLSVEENELLTQVGPGTPMGELMRRYWQPVCAVDELERSWLRTKETKVLGEELVVFRDRRGSLGVIDKYCMHRRASMAYGVVEHHLQRLPRPRGQRRPRVPGHPQRGGLPGGRQPHRRDLLPSGGWLEPRHR